MGAYWRGEEREGANTRERTDFVDEKLEARVWLELETAKSRDHGHRSCDAAVDEKEKRLLCSLARTRTDSRAACYAERPTPCLAQHKDRPV